MDAPRMPTRFRADRTDSMTEVRDLRTGVPVWASGGHSPFAGAPLLSPAKADVVIVGSGITGALMALVASQKGLSTIVIDRRPPAQGSTAASTALLQFEIDTPLIRLADRMGMERASRAWLRCFHAVDDLASLVRRLRIPCDFRQRRALYLAGETLSAVEMAEEGRQRQRIGLPSTFLSAAKLRSLVGIERSAALLSDHVADLNPVRLTLGLLRRAARAGCRIHSPVQLAEVAASAHGVEMITSEGIELEAKALVFATGYELADGVPSAGHRRTSTWAFATPSQAGALWGNGELIWEACNPYLYLRTTADGGVLVGGEDEDFSDAATRDALLSKKIDALQKKARQLFPRLNVDAEFAWAGTFGESENGLPSIGAIPGMPNCYAVLGYGGNGFTFAMIAAQIIEAKLFCQTDPDADLFAFDR
jgi:glycine/D-amino acid oxidase-like deaminating enzyme